MPMTMYSKLNLSPSFKTAAGVKSEAMITPETTGKTTFNRRKQHEWIREMCRATFSGRLVEFRFASDNPTDLIYLS